MVPLSLLSFAKNMVCITTRKMDVYGKVHYILMYFIVSHPPFCINVEW